MQIPKSINRLRLKGSGSRFVHGGATLQEVVIPVISINKKRQSDVGKVGGVDRRRWQNHHDRPAGCSAGRQSL